MRLVERILTRLRFPERRRRRIIDEFHRLYYESSRQTWKNTRWLGVRAYKTPLDLWVYQELLVRVKPELIIETGTSEGGSALFLATVCDLLGCGEILTIDTASRGRRAPPDAERPRHARVTYLKGSSTAPEMLKTVAARARDKSPIMVVLDSNHTFQHVLDELRHYADFVTPGSYLVVEDTNLNGHPILPDLGPGPTEAVQQFLAERSDFAPDREQEKFLLTFNPGGYLRRQPRSMGEAASPTKGV